MGGTKACWAWVLAGGKSRRGFPAACRGPPLFSKNLGRQECGRLPWDNGPLSCRVAAGPQTMGLGRALACCPWPETDAQEPPVGALEATSWAALSLRGRTPEREVNGGGLMPGARPPAQVGGSPGRARPGRCCYCVGDTGAFPGLSQPGAGQAWGWRPSCCPGRTQGADFVGPIWS